MAGISEKVKYLGKAVRGAVSPKAWAEKDAVERGKLRATYEAQEKEKRTPSLPESLLQRSPKVKKIYLGGK